MSEPDTADSDRPSGGLLLVAMPALDEAQTIGEVLAGVPRSLPGVARVETLVVDDGSRDRTAAIARAAGAAVVAHGRSRGVGAAFHSALRHATETGADFLVTIDSDGQFDPADIPRLAAPVIAGEADFATASRFVDPALVPRMPFLKLWGNRRMAGLISRLAGQTLHDVSCGFRCYSRQAMLQLHLLGQFTYTQEVLLNLCFKQLRIAEVPLRVRGERKFGESRVASSLWRYAVRTVQIIFRCYRDYRPMALFGGAAITLAVPATALAVFLGAHYLVTGSFSPHKWAGFTSGTLFILSLLLMHLGLIGDMLVRHRVYLEELLQRDRMRAAGDPAIVHRRHDDSEHSCAS